MKDTLGLILTEEVDIRLKELTEMRSLPALPIAGRYRLIDFILSNLVNSGIINVGITTRYNYSSLMDHLGSGSPWDLQRNNYGLFVLPPFVSNENGIVAEGSVDVIKGVIPFLKKSKQKYVVLSEGHTIFNMTFYDAMRMHKENDADVTVFYNEGAVNAANTMLLEIDEQTKQITDAKKNSSNYKNACVSMNVCIIDKHILIKLVEDCASRGKHDFVMDCLIGNRQSLKVFGYKFDGYVGRVDNVNSFFENNMNMLDEKVRTELFGQENKIFTKIKNQVPTLYGDDAQVSDSLIADGCVIEGKVENCVVFRGVRIGKDTVVKDSILMEQTCIQDKCDLECAIIDKECMIRSGKRLCGQKNYPIIIRKGAIV